MQVFYPGRARVEFGALVFVERGKAYVEPAEKPSLQDENQQQTQPLCDTGPELNQRHTGGRPCSPKREIGQDGEDKSHLDPWLHTFTINVRHFRGRK